MIHSIKQTFISIIIPAYNEEKRIIKTLKNYVAYYNKHYYQNYQILVVLNGCRDNTEKVVVEFIKQNPTVEYIVFPDAIGKGGALKEGLKVAKGKNLGFTDADDSTRPEILHRLFSVLEMVPTLDCVIGSRRMVGSVVSGKSKGRGFMSWGFNTGVNILFSLGIRDTQCGAKVFRSTLVSKILPSLTISNMAFDVNFLVDAKKVGAKILEMPIEWEDEEGSTIKNNIGTSVAMALSVLRLRMMYSPLKGLYPVLEPIGIFLLKILSPGSRVKKID